MQPDAATAAANIRSPRLADTGSKSGYPPSRIREGPLLNERPPRARPKKSANEFHALLLFDLSFCCRLSGKLKNGRLLALPKRGQENHLPIRKLERVMVCMGHVLVDLSKDRRFVTECSLLRPQ